jgi:hypothetical protein
MELRVNSNRPALVLVAVSIVLPGRKAALQPAGTDSKRVSKRAVGERAPGRDPIGVAI